MNNFSPEQQSTLKRLRSLSPSRACTFDEALGIAERQAAKLNHLFTVQWPSFQLTGITEDHLAAQPRLRIIRETLPVSGMSHWTGREWLICLNKQDPEVRQRFTLLHEYKHIVDHGRAEQLYTGDKRITPHQQAERAADYFTGCALVPRTALKHAWGNGLQRPVTLAEHFGVSEAAIVVRLDQTGLSRECDVEPEDGRSRGRCRRPAAYPTIQNRRWA